MSCNLQDLQCIYPYILALGGLAQQSTIAVERYPAANGAGGRHVSHNDDTRWAHILNIHKLHVYTSVSSHLI